MKITALEISNFRGIRSVKLSGLGDTIVIAGPNGCGKSCIFDAIRLVKSYYGGYQANEWQQWFSEFQIRIAKDPEAIGRLFRDPGKPLTISLEVALSPDEQTYLKAKAPQLAVALAWRATVTRLQDADLMHIVPNASEQTTHRKTVDRLAVEYEERLLAEIARGSTSASLTFNYGKADESITDGLLTTTLFSLYDTPNVGVIDYHGPHRTFAREDVGGSINLHIEEATGQQYRQSSLYNYSAKYQNIKSEMATAYVTDIIAREKGLAANRSATIVDALKALFQTFFPGKEFDGPKFNDKLKLAFPVRLADGSEHDMNDLSSGEKEILFGYLRLRKSAPKQSVILLDEPELHLNPKLIRELPGFYHKHIGTSLSNQLWMITHSDALLRGAIGFKGVDLYHMEEPVKAADESNQVLALKETADVESAVYELVGDLAAFNPSRKIVLIEGDDASLDVEMLSVLCPDQARYLNLVPGRSKRRVGHLYDLLKDAQKAAAIRIGLFAIVDRDLDDVEVEHSGLPDTNVFKWSRYHIENYLLDSSAITLAANEILPQSEQVTETEVESILLECATEVLPDMIRLHMDRVVSQRIVSLIHKPHAVDPSEGNLSTGYATVAPETAKQLTLAAADSLSENKLRAEELRFSSTLKKALATGHWRNDFRGRDILRRFVGKAVKSVGVRYDVFRRLLVRKMREIKSAPVDLSEVLQRIVDT